MDAPITIKAYCNQLAIQKGLDPGGYAGSFDDAILIETPLPWRKDMMRQANPLPQQVIDLLMLWLMDYQQGKGYPHRPLVIAPDEAYSVAGFRRVIHYTRPQIAFGQYDKIEYLVPIAEMGALIWALYQDRDALMQFESYRQPQADAVRDILVCTHGTIDAACAKFGYPLYNMLRRHYANEQLHVWRVSHFGGHVFAPTLIDMPTGHYWAYVEDAQAHQIITRAGDVLAMRGHYRGWAGFDSGFLQSAERHLWQLHGWRWFDYVKQGEILSQDPNTQQPQWAEVRICYLSPSGESGTYEGRVEVRRYIETITTTGDSHTYHYPQYHVIHLERVS
ncbi:MAG: sucrase ferredoxin [Phototrophicales bacterium]|nr:MAG: sucrase ferredoxin [Phototrophicales bacterium]